VTGVQTCALPISRRLNGIIDAAARSAQSDHVARHLGLRQQVLDGHIEIARPFFALDLPFLLRRQLFVRFAVTPPKAAVINLEDVDPRRRELQGQAVPTVSIAVALMQQKDSGTRLARVKIGRAPFGSVRSFSGPRRARPPLPAPRMGMRTRAARIGGESDVGPSWNLPNFRVSYRTMPVFEEHS